MSVVLAVLALAALSRDVTSSPWKERSPWKEQELFHNMLSGREVVPKILNGVLAKPGEFPFIVSLEVDGDHFCGGSIYSEYWVVSAAHCFPFPGLKEQAKVRAGSLKSGSGGTLHAVEDVILHEKYMVPSMLNNDLALVKLRDPLVLGDTVKAIRLAKPEDVLEQGTDVISTGWGITTSSGETPSPDLLKVELKVVDRKKCNKLPGIRSLREQADIAVTGRMICARTPGSDTTHGDSGGPLVHREGDELVLVGVVSWGEGKGDMDSPGVYTNVAKFIKWIYKKTHSMA